MVYRSENKQTNEQKLDEVLSFGEDEKDNGKDERCHSSRDDQQSGRSCGR